MKILVACEFSGVVREAFRRRGHDAWSCDLLDTEIPGQHIKADVRSVIGERWDLMVAHPPCTYLTVAGNKYFKPEYASRFPTRQQDRERAIEFFMLLVNSGIERVAIENPIGVISTRYRKPDQIIQPYQFGHQDRKPTCLWLKGLNPLLPTRIVSQVIVRNRNGKTASAHHDAALRLPPAERWKVRSRTYDGIAEAMAEQWGGDYVSNLELCG